MTCTVCGNQTAIAYYSEFLGEDSSDSTVMCSDCYFSESHKPYIALKTEFNRDRMSGKPSEAADVVVHPAHYAKEGAGVECIEAIKSSMSPEAYRGYLKGNTLKYLWRYESKGKPVQDLEKASVYLRWLLEEVKNG